MHRPRLSLTCAILALFLAGPAAWAAEPVPAAALSKMESDAASDISRAVRDRGKARVIVELDLPVARGEWAVDDTALRRHALDLRVLQMAVIGSAFGASTVRAASENGFDDNAVTLMSVSPMFAADVDAAALGRLAADRRVLRIHPDRLNKPDLTNTTFVTGMQGESGAWALGATGLNLGDPHPYGVAILDTGVQLRHPFLPGRVPARDMCFSTRSTAALSSITCPNNASSMFGRGAGVPCPANVTGCDHGTHVAGIAAGTAGPRNFNFAGTARSARIQAVQVFSIIRNGTGASATNCGTDRSPCARTFDSDFIRALDQIYRERVTTWIVQDERIDVQAVNMSLGSGSNSGFCPNNPAAASIRNLKAAGIAVFMSAGNGGLRNGVGSPACIADGVTIANANTKVTPFTVSMSSNMGPQVDLVAAGSTIRSSILNSGYGNKSGTSMAAPAAAGAFVAIRSKLRHMRVSTALMTVDSIVNAMRFSGTPLRDNRPGGSLTRPLLRADRALSRLMPERIIAMTPRTPNPFEVTFEEGYVNPRPAFQTTYSLGLLTPGRAGWAITGQPAWVLVQPKSGVITSGTSQVFVGAGAGIRKVPAGTHRAVLQLKNRVTGQTITRTIVARVTPAHPPANDPFASPTTLASVNVDQTQSTFGTNRGATLQTGEMTGAGAHGRTVWYTYTPAISGLVDLKVIPAQILVDFPEYRPNVRVYRGDALSALQSVAVGLPSGTGNATSFSGVAGTRYRIAVGVDAVSGLATYPWGSFRLDMTQRESRIVVTPQGPYTFVRRVGETSFTPPFIDLTLTSPTGNLTFDAYTGLSDYITIAPSTGSVDFAVPTTIRVTPKTAALGLGVGSTGGSITIGPAGNGVYRYETNVVFETRPSNGAPGNDNRANAVAIADPYGEVFTLSGSNTNASREIDEPRNPSNQGDQSVWWTFNAAPYFNGSSVFIDTIGSNFDTTLAVYRWTGSQLVLMAANDDISSDQRQSRLSFNLPDGNNTYYVAVDGYKNGLGSTASGSITLTVRQPRNVLN